MGRGSTIRERFEQMVAGLRENPNIEIEAAKLGKPATESALGKAKSVVLPKGLEQLCREMDGFTLKWSVAPGLLEEMREANPFAEFMEGGSINLQPIARIARGERDSGSLRHPIDIYVPERYVGFANGSRLVWCDVSPENTPIGYSFPEYLDRLLLSRGYLDWVATLCAGCGSSSRVRGFQKIMPRLFSDYRREWFRPKA